MAQADQVAALRGGNVPVLARAISQVENGRAGFEALLSAIHPTLGHARRIGITGPPGAGKSTLTERLVQVLRAKGHTVAVVAVDPTSPFTGGALLGDRIRMESVALDPGVYIRSMATRGSLGGLATTTREVCDVLDAAGFDRILIETVGVGQSELDVGRSADTTVLVLVPESGDGIQTLKSGVMEIGDIFVVNKSDRPGADRLRQEIEITLGIRAGNAYRHVKAHHGLGAGRTSKAVGTDGTTAGPPATERSQEREARLGASESLRVRRSAEEIWKHPVLGTVASKGEGIEVLADALDGHHQWLTETGELGIRRRRRLFERTREVVDRASRQWIWQETAAEQMIHDRLDDLAAGRTSPYEVAGEVLDGLKQGTRV
ncbi:MAG TPA: methylmalonyl Co-A mutase-associated GTPase MeaB [Gemmatimonadales bacterium]|nr:methylmalonyl Co-A mutase-associated GTPase MeaB [Gemmatimonadales bacterium]